MSFLYWPLIWLIKKYFIVDSINVEVENSDHYFNIEISKYNAIILTYLFRL